MKKILNMQAIRQFIVIDDDTSTLFLCKFVIERVFENISVVTYSNPQNAVDYFLSTFNESPVATVVILDINMPELSGWDVLDEISKLEKKITDNLFVFIHSSSIDPKDKLQATSHPLVLGYLEKPLTPAKLEEMLVFEKDKSNTY